ncbi:hypothetical protein GGX14DRAFT_577526 [Mycena pura]|uniref:Uncharacterized protein n=1 Tax=Mycena pura TaxID=153505 RepID=A0AAD6URQ8_9AGAR|nr:hypothetical protein GGX14DRAFT_577526 [Mycena pura]
MGDTVHTFPADLDPYFRHPIDAPDDFKSAFEHAMAFSAILGDTCISDLWRQALVIRLRAGHGGATETAPKCEAFDNYFFGHNEGVKEDRTSSLRDGKKEGREFAKKQAAKLSKTPAPKRVLIDAGMNSPFPELFPSSPPPINTYATASAQTDAQSASAPPILNRTPPLTRAEEPSGIHIPEQSTPTRLPPRDFSALHSDFTSAPFAILKAHGGLDVFGDGLNLFNGLVRTEKHTHMQNPTSLAPSGI